MKEQKQINRMKCQKLKTLKLFQKINITTLQNNKQYNNNNLINNENKKKQLYKNNSAENILSKINENNAKKIMFSPMVKGQEKKQIFYKNEKSIPKSPFFLLSKKSYHFGKSRIIMLSKFQKNESNHNISTKMSEQNVFIPKSNLRTVVLTNHIKTPKERMQKIKLRNTNQLSTNKMEIYKRYNNDIGFDKHRINKSCIFDKPTIERTYYNNSTKEDISKISKLIYSRNNNNQLYNCFSNTNSKSIDPFSSTIVFSSNKNTKKKISYNSVMCLKEKNSLKKENNTKKTKINEDTNITNTNTFFDRYFGKYHFVMNDYLVQLNKKREMPFEIKNINKNNCNTLLKENEKLFSFYGSIIPHHKFSEKYRDPLNNSFDKELKEERDKKEKTYIKQEILPGLKLLKEMESELQERKEEKKQSLSGKALMHKIKIYLIRNVQFIKRLKISYEELFYQYKRVSKPFEYYKTEELIMEIKNKNYDKCGKVLDDNKHIVLDYDYFHFTPLHWAVKVNFYQIIPKLISYGAPVNDQNNMGETPLHISASKNYYESTVLLLIYLASPFIKDNEKRRPGDRTKDLQMNFMFKKIIELHLKYIVMKQKNFYNNVQKDFIDFINMEFTNQLKKQEILDLITNII